MAIACLDADILVEAIRGEKSLSRFSALTPQGICTTVITLMELYYGAFKSSKSSDIGLIDSLGNDIQVIGISEKDVKLAGRIMAELEAKGQKLDFRDIIIGSICINRDFILITNNVKHFSRMKDFGISISKL